jgi:hypothetical protein
LKLTNRQDYPMSLTVMPQRDDVVLGLAEPDFKLEAGENRVFHLRADVPDNVFQKGRLEVGLTIENDRQQQTKVRLQLLGPLGS